MNERFLGLLALLAAAPLAAAQTDEETAPTGPAELQATLTSWRAAHGVNWRAQIDSNTGYVEMLYGGNAPAHFTPNSADDADWFALARHWVAATEGLHGVSSGELVDGRVVYLPLGMANGTDKLTVQFHQEILGLPVESARVNVLFDTTGRLLSVHSTAAPSTQHLSGLPSVSASAALRTAQAAFESETGVPALHCEIPELLHAQVLNGRERVALLAWSVDVFNHDQPAGKTYTIDAVNGQIVRRDEAIHHFDVWGQLMSMATPGTEADHSGNPEQEMPMSYIRVSSSSGDTTWTDRDGNFNFAGLNTAVDLTLEYNGTFNNVNNQAGSDYTVTFNNVQPGTANHLVMNPSSGALITAQANAYQHMNVLRDYIRDTVPTDSTADFKALSNTNISSTCNAYFDGSSVNFYQAGGSCNNTAFSSVIVHELGHWLNVKYGTGNGSDGMGEGNADTFSMYVYDDPIVGRYFFTSGGYVRTGNNTRQYCGDGNGGCYGQVHADGEVWMGASWKVRRNLKTTLGDALGGATADQLFVGWLNAYNQTQIHSIIEIQWLTLDDDNGDIGDGTPNYQDIDSGFREQGFPGYDLDFMTWSNVTDLPDVPSDAGPYTVNADVVATLTPPVTSVTLHYSVNGAATVDVPMPNVGGDTYSADIPSLGGLGFVDYWLSAQDSGGGNETYPEDDVLDFVVGEIVTLTSWDFEATGDEGWQGGMAGDTATTGQWVRGDPIATAAQPGNDHTPGSGNVNCWFTGQGSPGGSVGENDVDNGITTLQSPVLNMDGLQFVRVDYWRWYSNDEGAAPNEDTLRVRLSGNGGSSWTTVETVGPGGSESSGGWFEGGFLVDEFMTPTSTMVFKFVAEDKATSGSIVEAAIDDVAITFLTDGCTPALNYCVTTPNSVGPGAVMYVTGSQDVDDNDLLLSAGICPANQFGLFFYGPGQGQTSVGDGTMCIDTGSFFRLPVVQTDFMGIATFQVDFNSLPLGGDIQNGDTMNFQFWYRDPAGGPAGYNFSDGISVEFCDL